MIDDYVPVPDGLPSYVLNLATDVNWEEEMPCFQTFCKETADFFSYEWTHENDGNENDEDKVNTLFYLGKLA